MHSLTGLPLTWVCIFVSCLCVILLMKLLMAKTAVAVNISMVLCVQPSSSGWVLMWLKPSLQLRQKTVNWMQWIVHAYSLLLHYLQAALSLLSFLANARHTGTSVLVCVISMLFRSH